MAPYSGQVQFQKLKFSPILRISRWVEVVRIDLLSVSASLSRSLSLVLYALNLGRLIAEDWVTPILSSQHFLHTLSWWHPGSNPGPFDP